MNGEFSGKSSAALPEDATFMAQALAQGAQAATLGEVPMGAVLVRGGQVLAAAHNAPISLCDPTAHAEVLVLRAAAQKVANYRLSDCTLYVTAEPCAMCAGAIVNARLARVVYAVDEPRTGAAGSQLDVFANPSINAHTHVTRGVLADAARAQLQAFFAQQRARQKKQRLPLRDDAVRLLPKAEAALQHAQAARLSGHTGASASAQVAQNTWQSGWYWHEQGGAHGVNALSGAHAAASGADEAEPSVHSAQAQAAPPAKALAKAPAQTPHGVAPLLPQPPPATSADLPWRVHQWHGKSACATTPARALALVHGWGECAALWQHWAPAAQQAGWQVCLPDLLGHGLSDKPKRAKAEHVLCMAQALLAQLQTSSWAKAQTRTVVLDASLLPLLHAHAEALGLLAPSWQGVQWRWVRRAGQGGSSAVLRKPWSVGFPAQLSALQKLLPKGGSEGGAGQTATAQPVAWGESSFPDAGHLSLLRAWLQHEDALAAPNEPSACQGQALRNAACMAAPTLAQPNGCSAFAQLPHRHWDEANAAQGWQRGLPAHWGVPRCAAQLPALGQALPAWPQLLDGLKP